MSAKIMRMYREAKKRVPSVKIPEGKGIHTEAFHRMALAIKEANPSYSMKRCYAIAMAKLGRNKAVKKSHWQK